MDGSDFFIFGGVLVAAALVLSAIGIRGKASFPGSRPLLVGATALFAAVVAATGALAVVNAREEQEHREEELAHEETAAEEGAEEEAGPGGEAAEGGADAGEQPAAGATTLDVTSPEDGSLAFEPDALEAPAGPVMIAYANPSEIQHSIAVEAADGTVLGETAIFTDGEEQLTLEDVPPGQYVFFCTVPGHREGGMLGDLEVK